MITMSQQMDYIVSRSGKHDPREIRRAQIRRERARHDRYRKDFKKIRREEYQKYRAQMGLS